MYDSKFIDKELFLTFISVANYELKTEIGDRGRGLVKNKFLAFLFFEKEQELGENNCYYHSSRQR